MMAWVGEGIHDGFDVVAEEDLSVVGVLLLVVDPRGLVVSVELDVDGSPVVLLVAGESMLLDDSAEVELVVPLLV